MEEVPYPSDMERLRKNIREELTAQKALGGLGMDEATVERLVGVIADNIDYAFSVEWAPRWVHGDDPHRWQESSGDLPTMFYVECLRCKRITSHHSKAKADAWWESHQREHA